MPNKETAVQHSVLECFAHHGFTVMMPGWKTPYLIDAAKGVVWRNNVGGMRDKTGRHFVKYGINGMPDIMGFVTPNGRTIGFEVKYPGEKPTDLQVWFGEMMTKAGGIWGWGTSYDDCDKWLKQAGL